MTKLDLQLKTKQRLALTPELRQALKLLQLPVVELSQHLQQALETNVMLELDANPTQADSLNDSPDNNQVTTLEQNSAEQSDSSEATENDDWQINTITLGSRLGTGGDTPFELQVSAPISLREHLLWQLDTGGFSDRQRSIGRIFIDAINDDGYLESNADQLTATFCDDDSDDREFADMLEQIRLFDPIGIAAETLQQCLSLQLQALDIEKNLKDCTQSIINHELDAVANHNIAHICRQLKNKSEIVEHAIAIIRALDPYPGRRIGETKVDYIVPDVYVRKHNGKWVVSIDDKYIPRLRINAGYAKAVNKSEYLTLSTQLREAKWLLRSLELRRTTLSRVANAIVKHQQAFFDGGDLCITPLLMRDLAEELELHESTISRVTANKYMHTSRGVVPFRHFFSLGLGGDTGDKTSTVAIQAMIRKLVSEENPQRPLSDQKLVDALAAKGIDVARRTVAKYRGLLGIGSTSERRQG
ncbi:MAG: RNA polymerase factor sigma-54 [Gammaproteobacteria bacterium]|nr:RNA polymerase factor sigma-54 [Gammaproteobacteria bacterium]